MNRQLQQMLGLWISYGSQSQSTKEKEERREQLGAASGTTTKRGIDLNGDALGMNGQISNNSIPR